MSYSFLDFGLTKLNIFSSMERDLLDREIMLGTWPLLKEETISVLDSAKRQKEQFSACLEGRSVSCILKYGATCGIEDRGAAVL
ncbi:CDG_1a_G0004950.mRNA.1.CDS.1 [Saccharomyces cerevisiae]|nr:CDG_1a_G0004950.mRNA.1.CDS.1 [Saccharomyces cerevisiae]CAI7163188.1 CDG_1a_G0004950.mRNA.1.CDS.1 [Saccharomyces cerevisiae]